MDKQYVIQGPYDEEDKAFLYWSNRDGWVDLHSATVFTHEECECHRLPMEATHLAEIDAERNINLTIDIR